MNHSDTLFASAAAALPDIGSDGALPESLQVFPPGKGVKFTLQDYPGQEFELDVDASTAELLDANLQRLLARAAAGDAAEPFADKNHEDSERTFTPVRYFWAGDDPKAGGVRLVPDWVPFGAALVRAKAFKYFSQNFLFSKARKKVIGLINENIGGLVNRPGFATQAAFARADISRVALPETTTENDNEQNTMTKDDLSQITAALGSVLKPLEERICALEGRTSTTEGRLTSAKLPSKAVSDFTEAVKASAKADHGGDLVAALSDITCCNPGAATDYLLSMRGRR